ncbi:hypothetical protein K431DRAFT_287899 [Polychaeton citri CBS 116435]|uniref:ELMO domain-containing protein n=1 Tax=Polychaeton citri CBS 116435 TaxID=1314669 RepID=A0A9P4Q522_9PEZI|nr:hypothetical protein K431DRAFT_287899 [Polychaeton citri CBS 116435]
MEDIADVESLVAGLMSDSESSKKYSVFKLQGLLSDPLFADAFVQGDGLEALRAAVLDTNGNTQAYALGSLDVLLELDMGWEAVDDAVIEKAVALAASHPLVNIVRNAISLLVFVVSRPLTTSNSNAGHLGFAAIKPALDMHSTFLESLVQRLSASDHQLCANALQLVNALMRDAVVNGGENEWPKFIKRLQDLGVIGGVGMLMRSDAASDTGSALATAIIEFQTLTKVLLKKWKQVRVNVETAEHKRALKTIHLLSRPEPWNPEEQQDNEDSKPARRHHPEKWRRLGFETESPAWEFDETGYLGMMDLVDYARRHEDTYHKILLEQAAQDREERCPLARASLSVTLILYEHFEIDTTADITPSSLTLQRSSSAMDRQPMSTNLSRLYRPLLLQWGRLHTAALNAFLRLWKAAGAEQDDFFKIEEVVRIVVEHIIGNADRRMDIAKVEEELRNVGLETARNWQMEGLDEVYEDAWGPHLVQIREQLHHESLQFMKEQRIRCLLKGSWFPTPAGLAGISREQAWRFVRLSHNKRWLHYQNYAMKSDENPPLKDLPERIDLDQVTSVDSNVTANATDGFSNGFGGRGSTDTLMKMMSGTATQTKITILGHPPKPKLSPLPASSHPQPEADEVILLELLPQRPSLASEWLDGLLMLLNQQPITKDTTSLVAMMEDWGVRLRMLNLRWEDVDWSELEERVRGGEVRGRDVPSRDGLDDDFWYQIPEV